MTNSAQGFFSDNKSASTIWVPGAPRLSGEPVHFLEFVSNMWYLWGESL